jgi:hypothetical protein
MCRALPGSEYYGGSAPPGPFSGRRAYPGQRAGCPPPGTQPGGSRVSLSFARRRRSPAVSQRHRHRYAADLPHGLPGLVKEPSREVPAAQRSGGTHRARPVSTRFEPVHEIKDVTTPVPRVLLSATLAGPAPSGSTGTSRLCRGCSRPPRHHPGQAAPSFTALLRQDGGEGLSPPLEQQRLAAPSGAASRRSPEAEPSTISWT